MKNPKVHKVKINHQKWLDIVSQLHMVVCDECSEWLRDYQEDWTDLVFDGELNDKNM